MPSSASASSPSSGGYYLNFTGGYVTFDAIESDLGSDYSWDIEFRAANNTGDEFLVLAESVDVENFIILRNDNTIDYKVNSSQQAFSITDSNDETAIYRFEARSGIISLYENGSLVGSNSYPDVKVGGTFAGGFSQIGNARGDITRRGALYYIKYTDNNNSLNNRYYDASASHGTGQILPDTDSGSDGSLVGFPTDDSQWVQYGSVATSSDVSFTINKPAFTSTVSASLPQPSASIAYSVNAPTFTADATATLPNPTANVSYTVNAPAFSVSGGVTLPQPTANATLSLPTPTFAASATATEPNFNAVVSFTLPAPTFNADATATLPKPVADGNFTITAPTFSVVAIVGGIAIIVDNETNINMPALSTNINAPVLSNNVRI